MSSTKAANAASVPNHPRQLDQPSVIDRGEKVLTRSTLHGPLILKFNSAKALNRGTSGVLPKKVYRYSHEKNGTLSAHVSRVRHDTHPDNLGVILEEENAFQTKGTLKAEEDFTPERLARHFVWNMTRDPTVFISTTSSLKIAEERARHLHDKSRKVPRCLVVTGIDTSNLVPAILVANMSTTPVDHEPDQQDPISIATTKRTVRIPIWIADGTPYLGNSETRPDCEVDDVLHAGGNFWFCVDELVKSDFRIWVSKKHKGEWLATSRILQSSVTNVMPFDGAILHTGKSTEQIRSRCAEPYFWNFDTNRWDHNPDLRDYRPYRHAKIGDKRKLSTMKKERYRKIAAMVTEYLEQIENDVESEAESHATPDSVIVESDTDEGDRFSED
ncbi:hypothetical protein CFE70_003930 [Pyrenophora teres f. teres 0-1]|uniref:Uncharacterized protein n=2 Tax=Pyrenophora teres f. teres TaxID=97479 RepID=E3S0V8_PYRTT|nr:hypothetical protein PTT_15750 [Pyrenophora teres f. teres 0-1]KAE8845600.1 hypothetical protein HRS9139_00167 [Pyrenophora teres f. teres]KAE8854107.1 hypothetical protein HRS9122_01099 [Pyrenophora teres f. teres]KAE8867665.1 hypothetical protein PTNB29_01576 [Pyrenophora teres f. teres]KAE8872430.1 hypothetical protein PTNB73_01581 [Pyrenophora teres f. teres]